MAKIGFYFLLIAFIGFLAVDGARYGARYGRSRVPRYRALNMNKACQYFNCPGNFLF